MSRIRERSKSQEACPRKGDKRSRLDSGAAVIMRGVSSSDDSSSFSSAIIADNAANVVAPSSPTAGVEATQELINLPDPITEAEGASNVIQFLQTIENDADEEANQYAFVKGYPRAYPVIIGSRAAAFWVPSFRACGDWDIVATPTEAVELIKDYGTNTNLNIKLIRQPLMDNIVIYKESLSADTHIKQTTASLPKQLYKIIGENVAAHIKFEIEIATNDRKSTAISSATRLLKLCHAKADDASYLNVSFGSDKETKCVIAPVSVLEILKSSHIYWPACFAKHIADLHTLRAIMSLHISPLSGVKVDIYADKNKPLTPPTRSPETRELLRARTLEVQALRGTPGAHFYLNMSNEISFVRQDDSFVIHHTTPNDDVRAMVAYGPTPIYNELKVDKSKDIVSRDLFEQTTYKKQMQCVKEEAMVIALERYLLPKLTQDPASAYRSALLRICTTLTKGWFRQFVVNNFPRLAVCDKNLLLIRDDILAKYPPLPPATRDEPLDFLRESVTSLDDLHLMKQLDSLTRPVPNSSNLLFSESDNDNDVDSYGDESVYPGRNRTGALRKKKDELSMEKYFWAIDSTVPGKPGLLVSLYKELYINGLESMNSHATLSVQLLTTDMNINHISAFASSRYRDPYCRPGQTFHKLAAAVGAYNGGESWSGGDFWSTKEIIARSLEDEVDALVVEGLTEELFMAYITALVKAELPSGCDTPLRNRVNALKANGTIPVHPANHLWFDYWKYHDVIN